MKHGTKRNTTNKTTTQVIDDLQRQIALNLNIDPERIKYADPGTQGKLGITGRRWLIHYRNEWRELPWHFDGPLCVTRQMVRQWYGEAA